MRLLTLSTLTVLPAALVAQAPVNFSEQLKTEQPVIESLLKALKPKEAFAKAQALIAVERPAYNTKDLNTVAQSMYVWRDLMSAHFLAAKSAFASGELEKGGDILQKALTLAKDNKAAFIAGAQPTLDTWKGPEVEAKTFLAEKPAKIQELNDDIAKVEKELTNLDAIKKMSKAEKNALAARQTKAQAEVEEKNQLESAKKVYEDNLKLSEKIHGLVDGTIKICDEDIKTVNTAIEKNQARIKNQMDEIQAYNTRIKEKNKAAKINGNSNYVNGVMEEHTNLTKMPTPEAQVSFLNRMLVLDPGNAKAQKALDNLLAGKDPFEVEKKPIKGKVKKAN